LDKASLILQIIKLATEIALQLSPSIVDAVKQLENQNDDASKHLQTAVTSLQAAKGAGL
jgi:hypothetical protein